MTTKTLTKNAFAKINLGLDVIGRRPDGYHLLRMIMQQIDLYDTLTFTAHIPDRMEEAVSRMENRTGGQRNRICLRDDSGLSPPGSDNLICRAVQIMLDTYAPDVRVEVHLEKRIPVAAGLAGGSTDAAAAFTAIRDLLVPEVTDRELMEMAVHLGADIPYCIAGGTKLAEGIGEKLTELPDLPDCGIVLVKPEASASTARVYSELDMLGSYPHPDIDGQIAALHRADLRGVMQRCGNVLEFVTGKRIPEIADIESFFRGKGALSAMMSGSGPTIFAVFPDMEEAGEAGDAFRKTSLSGNCRTFCVQPVR